MLGRRERRHKISNGVLPSEPKPDEPIMPPPLVLELSAFKPRSEPSTPLPGKHSNFNRSLSNASSTSLNSPTLVEGLHALADRFSGINDTPFALRDELDNSTKLPTIATGFDELESGRLSSLLHSDDERTPKPTLHGIPFPDRLACVPSALLLSEVELLTEGDKKDTTGEFTP